MKKASLVLLVFLLFTLACCTDTNNKTSLKICGSYAVPGMFYPDVKGSEADCKILETDSYGRILFEYTAPSYISDDVATVTVICQKIDEDYVYYYDSLCYQSVNSDFSELKENNDWNKELCSEKMTKRSTKTSVDGVIITSSQTEFSEVKALFCDFVGITHKQLAEICLDDADMSGNAIYFAEFTKNTETEKCLFIVSDNKIDDIFFLDSSDISFEEYLNFRLSVSWK